MTKIYLSIENFSIGTSESRPKLKQIIAGNYNFLLVPIASNSLSNILEVFILQ